MRAVLNKVGFWITSIFTAAPLALISLRNLFKVILNAPVSTCITNFSITSRSGWYFLIFFISLYFSHRCPNISSSVNHCFFFIFMECTIWSSPSQDLIALPVKRSEYFVMLIFQHSLWIVFLQCIGSPVVLLLLFCCKLPFVYLMCHHSFYYLLPDRIYVSHRVSYNSFFIAI